METEVSGKGYVLVTTAGHDRPGIVEEISQWLADQGGNIQESRMAQLGGEFATIIFVEGPADIANRLDETRAGFEAKSRLTVITRPVSASPAAPSQPVLRYILKGTALDHPGIVAAVTRLLNRSGVNIVSAETYTTSAPFSGAPIFHFEMEVDLPSDLPARKLRAELDTQAEAENIDYTLEAEG